VGGSNASVLTYERDEREIYAKMKEFIIPEENWRVTNMAVSPSEDCLVCTTENSQIYCKQLSNTEVKVSFRIISVHSLPSLGRGNEI
jgi:hypothetical protein